MTIYIDTVTLVYKCYSKFVIDVFALSIISYSYNYKTFIYPSHILWIHGDFMTTEVITLKLDDKFLDEIDSVVLKKQYHNRTEFIRNALREKIDEIKLKEAMISLAHLKGASKKKTTDEELERMREQVSEEFFKKIK
jgi:Arc/MetJ-type ribon-helix-helix transcriptional regulator